LLGLTLGGRGDRDIVCSAIMIVLGDPAWAIVHTLSRNVSAKRSGKPRRFRIGGNL
jgi:hypothetical protein